MFMLSSLEFWDVKKFTSCFMRFGVNEDVRVMSDKRTREKVVSERILIHVNCKQLE